jgi:hypothetical protein
VIGLSAGGALACQATGNPTFDDTFKLPDPGWGRADTVGDYTPNGLALTPPPNGSAWRLNQSLSLKSGDWCVEVSNPATLPSSPDEDSVGDVGIWFWGQDAQNFYTATISLDGTAAIDQLSKGQWIELVPPVPSSTIKTAPGASNELEIVVQGNRGTFYVNGSKIADFDGTPPENGGNPGVYGESGPQGTTWLFTRTRLF